MSARAWPRLALGRHEDPTTSRDPQVRAVVAGLGAVALPAPRAAFRAELRAQLVAVTPTLVVEPEVATEPTAAIPATPHRHRGVFPVGRVLRAATALVVVLGMLLGAGVWASRDALPGDALYGLKRGFENAQLHFRHGTHRGQTYLQYAGKRVDEVSALVSRSTAEGTGVLASRGQNAHTVSLIASTLDSADADLQHGSSILTDESNRQRSAAPLTILLTWAPDQQSVLRSIQGRLPAGAARDRVTASLARVDTTAGRAKLLAPLSGCGCFSSLPSDLLGPLPPGAAPSGTVRPGVPTPGVTVPAVPTSGGQSPGGGRSGSGSTGGPIPTPSLPSLPLPSLPSLPTKLPSLPSPSSLPIPTLTLPHLPGHLLVAD